MILILSAIFLFSILLSRGEGLLHVTEVYVSNDKFNCSNLCDGSANKPYSSLIDAFFLEGAKAGKESIDAINIYLIGETIIIYDAMLENYAGLFVDNVLPVPVSAWREVNIIPFSCKGITISNCEEMCKINVKSQNFFFRITGNLSLQNIIISGSDMNLLYNEEIHRNCYFHESECCVPGQTNPEVVLSCRNADLVVQYTKKRYGLFNVASGPGIPFSINFLKCNVQNFKAVKISGGESSSFTSLILVEESLDDLNSPMDITFHNVTMSKIFFYEGILAVITNRARISIFITKLGVNLYSLPGGQMVLERNCSLFKFEDTTTTAMIFFSVMNFSLCNSDAVHSIMSISSNATKTKVVFKNAEVYNSSLNEFLLHSTLRMSFFVLTDIFLRNSSIKQIISSIEDSTLFVRNFIVEKVIWLNGSFFPLVNNNIAIFKNISFKVDSKEPLFKPVESKYFIISYVANLIYIEKIVVDDVAMIVKSLKNNTIFFEIGLVKSMNLLNSTLIESGKNDFLAISKWTFYKLVTNNSLLILVQSYTSIMLSEVTFSSIYNNYFENNFKFGTFWVYFLFNISVNMERIFIEDCNNSEKEHLFFFFNGNNFLFVKDLVYVASFLKAFKMIDTHNNFIFKNLLFYEVVFKEKFLRLGGILVTFEFNSFVVEVFSKIRNVVHVANSYFCRCNFTDSGGLISTLIGRIDIFFENVTASQIGSGDGLIALIGDNSYMILKNCKLVNYTTKGSFFMSFVGNSIVVINCLFHEINPELSKVSFINSIFRSKSYDLYLNIQNTTFHNMKNLYAQSGEGFIVSLLADNNTVYFTDCLFHNIKNVGFSIYAIKKSSLFLTNCTFFEVLYNYDPRQDENDEILSTLTFSSFIVITYSNISIENSSISGQDLPCLLTFLTLFYSSDGIIKNCSFFDLKFMAAKIFSQKTSVFRSYRDNYLFIIQCSFNNISKALNEEGLISNFDLKSNEIYIRLCGFYNIISPGPGIIIYSIYPENLIGVFNSNISYFNVVEPTNDMSSFVTGCLFVIFDSSDIYLYSNYIGMNNILSPKTLLFYCNLCNVTYFYDLVLKDFRLKGDRGIVFALSYDFNISFVYCNIQNGTIIGDSGFFLLQRMGNYELGYIPLFFETFRIWRCLFKNISSTGRSAVVCIESKGENQNLKLNIVNCSAVNLKATSGTFIWARIRMSTTILNTRCENLFASQEGGFLVANRFANFSLFNCTFVKISSGITGGWVWSHDETKFEIKSCKIFNVFAKTGGFIILKKSCLLLIIDSEISFFASSGAGSFLITESLNTLLIQNTSISNGTAGSSPGMIELKENNLFSLINSTVYNVSIAQNKDEKFLGVIISDFFINVYLLKNVRLKLIQVTERQFAAEPILFAINSGNITLTNVSIYKLSGIIFSLDEHTYLFAIRVVFRGDFFQVVKMNKATALLSDIMIRNEAHFGKKKPGISSLSPLITLKASLLSLKHTTIIESITELDYGTLTLDTFSQIMLVESVFLLNRSPKGGVFCVFDEENSEMLQQATPLITLKNCKLLFNKAQFGGSLFLNTSTEFKREISISDSSFIGNRALKGGAIYFIFSRALKITNSNFTNNRAIGFKEIQGMNSPSGQGGVFFSSINEPKQTDLQFKDNNIYRNLADIGGVLFSLADELNISVGNNISSNKAFYYGDIYASTVRGIDLSHSNLAKSFKKENISTGQRDYYISIKTTLGPLKPGTNYTECLLEIIPYDLYGEKAYRNDEDFAKLFYDTSKINRYFKRNPENGAYCLSGILEGQSIPLSKENLVFTASINKKGMNAMKDNYFLATYVIEVNIIFQDCQIGDTLTTAKLCLPCETDHFSLVQIFNDFSATCIDCASSEKFYCFGGSKLTPKPGFWRFNSESNNFLKCPQKLACLGDPRSKNERKEYFEIYAKGLCAKGYTGVMCTECEAGFGSVDKYLCSSCDDYWYYAKVAGSLILHLFFILLTIHKTLQVCFSISGLEKKTTEAENTRNSQKSFLLKVFTNHFHGLSILASFPFEIPIELDNILKIGVSSTLDLSQGLTFECMLKKGAKKIISLVYLKLIVTAIYPICLLLLTIVYIKIRLDKNAGIRRLSKTTPLKAAFYIVMMLSYIDILQVNLKLLKCENVGDDVNNDVRLINDYGVECWTDEHFYWIYRVSLPISVCALILLPLRILIRLILPNFSKSERRKMQIDKDVLFKYGAFYYSYEARYHYWEFIIILRKIALILTSVFFFNVTNSLYPIFMIFLIFFLAFVLQKTFNPYDRKKFSVINEVEEKSLLALVFTTFVAVYYMNSRLHDNYKNLLSREIDKFTIWVEILFKIFLLFLIFAANIYFFIPWIKNYFKMQVLESINLLKKMKTLIRTTFKDKKVKNENVGNIQLLDFEEDSQRDPLSPDKLLFLDFLKIDYYHLKCRAQYPTDIMYSEDLETEMEEISGAAKRHSINRSLSSIRPQRDIAVTLESPFSLRMESISVTVDVKNLGKKYPPFYVKQKLAFCPNSSVLECASFTPLIEAVKGTHIFSINNKL